MANGRLTVFTRSAHGSLTHKFWDAPNQKWSAWVHLEGGEITSAPSAVMSGGRLVVFACNLRGTLTHRYYDYSKQDWIGWVDIGDGEITSAPSGRHGRESAHSFCPAAGRPARAPSSTTRIRTDGRDGCRSSPTKSRRRHPAVMAGQRLTVFSRNVAGRLTHTYYDPASGGWAAWKDLGTDPISSAPSAVMAGSRLTVFARAMDSTLVHLFYEGGWTSWQGLGAGQIT